jgi:hypothetical protein
MLYQVLIGVQKNETLSQRSRWRVAIHWIMDGHPPPAMTTITASFLIQIYTVSSASTLEIFLSFQKLGRSELKKQWQIRIPN